MKFNPYLALILLALYILYSYSVSPDPIVGDSLGFTVSAYQSFDFASNATNHLLYMALLSGFSSLVQINPHTLFTQLSIIWGLSFLLIAYQYLCYKGISEKIALICVLILGLSFTFFRQCIITEVYTFFLLLSALFYLNLEKFLDNKNEKYLFYASFFIGLMTLVHIQTILLFPLYLGVCLYTFSQNKKVALIAFSVFLFIFSLLLIPVFLQTNTLLSVFTDGKYEDSLTNFEFIPIIKSTIIGIFYFLYNFSFFVIPILLGIKLMNRKGLFLMSIIPYIVFCVKHNVSDNYVFQLLPYFLLLYPLALGLEFGLKKYPFLHKYQVIGIFCLLVPVFYFMATQAIAQTNYGKELATSKAYKGGVEYCFFPVLRFAPPIDSFMVAYEHKQLEENVYGDLYKQAKEWKKIKQKWEKSHY